MTMFSSKLLISLFSVSLLACKGDNSTEKFRAEHSVANSENLEKGKTIGQMIFEQKCAPCHGHDGTAGIGNAANLYLSVADSTYIGNIIFNGKSTMPSFANQLTKKEISNVIGYVINLQRNQKDEQEYE